MAVLNSFSTINQNRKIRSDVKKKKLREAEELESVRLLKPFIYMQSQMISCKQGLLGKIDIGLRTPVC